MRSEWQISAGELFELMRPVALALSALVSAWVLRSTRERGFRIYSVAAWTLLTLFFPLIVLPLYLIVRAWSNRRERESGQAPIKAEPPAQPFQVSQSSHEAKPSQKINPRPALRRASSYIWPALYLIVCVSLITVYFYRDYWSVDAHLWRASNAKLRGPHEKVIAEYRAALRLEDDPHTRKLLAVELAAAGRAEEALAEFRAAERGGEQDEQIPYRMGMLLDALGRKPEAIIEYKRFLNGALCTQAQAFADCATARARISTLMPTPAEAKR